MLSPPFLTVLLVAIITDISCVTDPISSISVLPSTVFPVELGQSVSWLFRPIRGSEYDPFSDITFRLGKDRIYRVQSKRCTGPLEKFFSCLHKPNNEISVTFTPNATHYGLLLQIFFYKDNDAQWLDRETPLYSEVVQLTRQPTYIHMSMQLLESSRFYHRVPTGLRFPPQIFLTGSIVDINCSTDGSLPPAPITFSIECPPPPTAVVEHDRVTQAKKNVAYEIFYRSYGFLYIPTLADLAVYVARKHADQILSGGHVSVTRDNLTLNARLTLNQKANDCHVVCRLGGKETRKRITVYYPTTIAYLLPRPYEGFVYVGSEITCHADGNPPPMLSLHLSQPLRPKQTTLKELDEFYNDPYNKDLVNTKAELNLQQQLLPPEPKPQPNPITSSGTLHQSPEPYANKQPFESATRVPAFGLFQDERDRQIGLLPNEYSIKGATFYLAPNATPGAELLLACSARNMLPGDHTFLNLNGTITTTRFVVAALPYTSWAIAVGVCACILLILLIVIVILLMQKKRQSVTGREARTNGSGGAKKSRNYSKDIMDKNKGSRITTSPAGAPLLESNYSNNVPIQSTNVVPNNMYAADPDYTYDPVYSAQSQHSLQPSLGSPQPNEDPHQVQYAELSFNHPKPSRAPRTLGYQSGGRISSSLHGGMTSASMTLVDSRSRGSVGGPKHGRSFGASVPQGLDISRERGGQSSSPFDESSHYTEILGIMQPKAHASPLVLQQQQEAVEAVLALKQNKPPVSC